MPTRVGWGNMGQEPGRRLLAHKTTRRKEDGKEAATHWQDGELCGMLEET